MHPSLFAALVLCAAPPAGDEGPFVRAFWLVQQFGTGNAVDPSNDQKIKTVLSKGLGKDNELTLKELEGFMSPETFNKLAGSDEKLVASEIGKALEASVPESRLRLLPKVRNCADALTLSFDMIDDNHRQAGAKLAEWIAENYQKGKPLDVIVVCTGNSRRSILGSTMGNIASAYYGMPEVRFHSGGTTPSAFNSRTVTALKDIGVEIEPTDKEAERGEPKTVNPIYRVRWGSFSASEQPMEALEFSKRYEDPANPRQGFAALMVCSEADAACPFVKGASLRVSMPYLDPKIFDGSPFESAKYAERRDDIGRLMLATMLQARQRVLSSSLETPAK